MKPSIPFSCKEGPGHVVPSPPAILNLIWGHMVDNVLNDVVRLDELLLRHQQIYPDGLSL